MRRFLSSQSAPWGVLDTWLNQGHPLGVFTVLADHARGDGWLAEVKGDHQGVWGWPWWTRVTREPADRTCEGRPSPRRQEETLGSAAAGSGLACPPSLSESPSRWVDATLAQPATWRSLRSRCTRSRGTPKTATAKGAGNAVTVRWPHRDGVHPRRPVAGFHPEQGIGFRLAGTRIRRERARHANLVRLRRPRMVQPRSCRGQAAGQDGREIGLAMKPTTAEHENAQGLMPRQSHGLPGREADRQS